MRVIAKFVIMDAIEDDLIFIGIFGTFLIIYENWQKKKKVKFHLHNISVSKSMELSLTRQYIIVKAIYEHAILNTFLSLSLCSFHKCALCIYWNGHLSWYISSFGTAVSNYLFSAYPHLLLFPSPLPLFLFLLLFSSLIGFLIQHTLWVILLQVLQWNFCCLCFFLLQPWK